MALTDVAIERIKKMILDGSLKPGDRLPREADLADQLGISRSSLREAVRALSMMRIIDFHQDSSVLDLFEVRRALEPMAAEKAALLMTDEDSAALLALVDSIESSATVEELVANDLEFHHRIALASGNTVLCSFIDGVAGRTQRARIWRGVTQQDAFDQTQREHRVIALATGDRQPSIAAALSLSHVAGIENWIRRSLADS